jgi:hypothetical protein
MRRIVAMSNNYYNPEDVMYYVKPSRVSRKRKSKWQQDAELERALSAWSAQQAEAQRSDANG